MLNLYHYLHGWPPWGAPVHSPALVNDKCHGSYYFWNTQIMITQIPNIFSNNKILKPQWCPNNKNLKTIEQVNGPLLLHHLYWALFYWALWGFCITFKLQSFVCISNDYWLILSAACLCCLCKAYVSIFSSPHHEICFYSMINYLQFHRVI